MVQRVQVDNGQCVVVLLVIPVIVYIHGHRLEVFMLVSEIHDNVDLVLGMKKVFELEGVIHIGLLCALVKAVPQIQDHFYVIFTYLYTTWIFFKIGGYEVNHI